MLWIRIAIFYYCQILLFTLGNRDSSNPYGCAQHIFSKALPCFLRLNQVAVVN